MVKSRGTVKLKKGLDIDGAGNLINNIIFQRWALLLGLSRVFFKGQKDPGSFRVYWPPCCHIKSQIVLNCLINPLNFH